MYRKDGKQRVALQKAARMTDKVIEIQRILAELGPELCAHPDVADAVTKAHALRGALGKLR